MTNEERDLITRFIQRVGGAPAATGFAAGSVPTTAGYAPPPRPLPPIDPEADALIAELMTRYPEARYRLTQLAFVQEQALSAAQARIEQLQAALQQAQQAAAQPASPWSGGQPGAGPQQRGGIFGGLFGGGSRQNPPPPPQYAPPPPAYGPGYNPGVLQGGGPGFLGSALTTAAGVAGGVLAANAISGLFSGHSGFGGGGFGAGGPTIVENVTEYNSSPWGAPPAGGGGDPLDVGGAPKDDPSLGGPGAGLADNSGWSPAPDAGGWQQADASDTDGDTGGWDDPGGDDFNNA